MSEAQKLLAAKAGFLSMTRTQGYAQAKQLSVNIVEKAKNDILDGKDSAEREARALKAIAMRDGFNDFFAVIEAATQFGTEEEAGWFSQLSFEEEQQTIEE